MTTHRKRIGLAAAALAAAAFIMTPSGVAHEGIETDIRSVGATFGEGAALVTVPVQLCYRLDGAEKCAFEKTQYVVIPGSAKLDLQFIAKSDQEAAALASVNPCPAGHTGRILGARQTGTRHRGFRAKITSADGSLLFFDSLWQNRDSTVGNGEVEFKVCANNADNGIPG